MTTNARLVGDVLPNKRSTFYALKELINNSIRAGATNIRIDLLSSDCEENSLLYRPIEKIVISDNGEGVSESRFANRIMEIATESEGNGTGRFAGLLIGRTMTIETIAYDQQLKKKTLSSVTFHAEDFSKGNINDVEFPVTYTDAESETPSGYTVTLSNLYNNEPDCARKNKLSTEFKSENFAQAIFEHYPFYLFNSKIKFIVNGVELKMEDFFLNSNDTEKDANYIDTLGKEHKVHFQFYSLKLSDKRVRVFLQPATGIKTIIAEFIYNSIWYSPDAMGAQFIVIDSDIITPDLYNNFTIEALGPNEWTSFSKLIKDTIDEHFKKGDVKFKSFLEKLGADKYYPYTSEERKNNLFSERLFERSVYLFEDDLKLLSADDKIRKIIYLLLRKAIEDGDLSYLFSHVLNLSKEGKQKLMELLQRTNMEEIVRFTSEVAEKEQFLSFLNELTYGKDIAKYILERKQLHKIVEKNLWIFGEEYLGTPIIWSDKNLGNNLDQLHHKYLDYKPSGKDGNLMNVRGGIRSITDLFFYNEKKLGNGRKEVMIVELKAPKCAIHQKELNQVDLYGYQIANEPQYPKYNVTYKILLISSKITDFAKSQINGNKLNEKVPFLYKTINDNNADIKIYVMEWSDLINRNQMQLSYLNNSLNVEHRSVLEMFEELYPEYMLPNRTSRLYESRKI